jgi:hypothetical protein
MIQDCNHPLDHFRAAPLAPPAVDDRDEALPAEARPAAALQPTGQSPPLPLVLRDDEYQWLILL